MTEDDDPELKAMGAIKNALKDLDVVTLHRVLEWTLRRFRPTSKDTFETVSEVDLGTGEAATTDATYKDFPALFDAADPDTMTEKVLVAAYWFQLILNQPEFDSGSLNRELKHLGHASSNITRDLDGLMAQTPRLVIQTRKSGSARQARKQYKLTTEGVRAVQRLIGSK